MAKIKKRKLRWKSSASPQVIGYKLYWAEDGTVGYHSPCINLGNVTEVVLPDDVPDFSAVRGPVELGITAVDEMGNESDLSVLTAPYQFNVPQAPESFWIETLEEGPASILDNSQAVHTPPKQEAAQAPFEDLRDDQEDSQPMSSLDSRTEEKRFGEMSIRGRDLRQV